MTLLTGKQLKAGNYYAVDTQKMVIFVSNTNTHVRLYYYRYECSIKILSNQHLNKDDEVYKIISKYSFFRVKRLIEKLINKML